MKTLTISNARQNLGEWMSRAINGEDIGIVHPATGQIVALRVVGVYSDDYAFTEYGIGPEEMKRIEKNVLTGIKKERKQGKLKPWKP